MSVISSLGATVIVLASAPAGSAGWKRVQAKLAPSVGLSLPFSSGSWQARPLLQDECELPLLRASRHNGHL